jgi:hypothetical protein
MPRGWPASRGSSRRRTRQRRRSPAPIPSAPTLKPSGQPSSRTQGNAIVVDSGLLGICPKDTVSAAPDRPFAVPRFIGPVCTFVITVTTTAPVSIASVHTHTITIGTATVTARPGAQVKVTFKLNKAGVRILRELRHLRAQVKVSMRVGRTKTSSAARAITIKAPRKKH